MKKTVFRGVAFVLWLSPAAGLLAADSGAPEKRGVRQFTVTVDPAWN
jgi:hypothetical protein